MNLVMHEIAQEQVNVEESSSESLNDGRFSSQTAEIVDKTATSRPEKSSVRSKPRFRSRRPVITRRRKPRPTRRRVAPGGAIVGTLVGINDSGQPLVRHPLDPAGRIMLARTTVPIDAGQVDREVVIAFEFGDIDKPIVLGVLFRTDAEDRNESHTAPSTVRQPIIQATLDGDQLVFTAEHEIVFRCGKASLTLTRAGKVLIRGTYVLSRSSGVNRIKGGSVQLN